MFVIETKCRHTFLPLLSNMKRKSECDQGHCRSPRPTKRLRHGSRVHLFDLSDELLLRVLAYLPVEDLTRSEAVCRKIHGLAQDNELWREKYFDQFIKQRARRLPSLSSTISHARNTVVPRNASHRARWLDETHNIDAGLARKWKHVFKVKQNWSRGHARTSEVSMGTIPGVRAKVHRGLLYTTDEENGLRIWQKGKLKITAQLSLGHCCSAFDIADEYITIGYTSGLVSVYTFDGSHVVRLCDYDSDSSIDSMAISWPYIMTMSQSSTINLLRKLPDTGLKSIATLKSNVALSPAALSLRQTNGTLVAGMAYCFNQFNSGFCLGLQELRMNLEGSILNNRVTSSVSQSLRESFSSKGQFTSRSTSTAPFSLHPDQMREPTSLSYNGCYVLASLPDNTLMLYTVTSTNEKLEINIGRRLWGHTSAVSAAEITSTGKALSISAKGDEIRYWEFEDLLASSSQQKTSTTIHDLGSLSNAIGKRRDGLGLALKEVKREAALSRSSVSFDDEQAIVVERRNERQSIRCFDFA